MSEKDDPEPWGQHDISLTQVSQLKDVFVTHKQLAASLSGIETRLGKLEGHMGTTKWLLGIGVLVMLGILAAVTDLVLRAH